MSASCNRAHPEVGPKSNLAPDAGVVTASYARDMQTAIEIKGLSKRFGSVQAVSGLDFTVTAGRVTGFLGPNGAGKSTTVRMLLGLIRPDKGTATFAGRRYHELAHASGHVGAVLENASFHPGRTARNHLRVLATAGEHPLDRVDDVLDEVGLTAAADRRVKGYSMGMRQRLAIAAALLGDPEVLILDEPTNGLDPPGIRWVRDLVRAQAEGGRAVLLSSHLLLEVAQIVDDVVVIANGTTRAHGPLGEVLGSEQDDITIVRTPAAAQLARLLDAERLVVERDDSDGLIVHGVSPARVGEIAAEHRVPLVELRPQARSLEEAFLAFTGGEV